MIREMRIFERSCLRIADGAELKADSILRGVTIQRERKLYLLGARKEVRIVKKKKDNGLTHWAVLYKEVL